MAEESKVVIKLLIDNKAKRVLFAEAGKDFVDFLFHLMSLPIGTIVNLLTVKSMVGCLGDLYKSIKALKTDYILSDVSKDLVLKPMVYGSAAVKTSLLLLNDAPTPTSTAKTFYGCRNSSRRKRCGIHVSDGEGAVCPHCGSTLTSRMTYVAPPDSTPTSSKGSTNASGGYVKGVVTYMVMDNLEVKPMSTISGITLINKFNVRDVAALVEKEVHVGLTQGVALLKASLQTKAVLTNVFL